MNSVTPLLLSVIIPTLNEAENLPVLLCNLKKQEQIHLEIVIGDGGSTDETLSIAEACGARVVTARQGRGTQMNAAAEQVSGNYLLFLHADSSIDDPGLLRTALNAITSVQHRGEGIAGHFSLRFQRTMQGNAMAYRYAEEKTAFNRVNTTNGDQGLLISRKFFRELGGFDERLPFLEDQRIAEKIRTKGQWLTLPGILTTSARRFEKEGFHRRFILLSMMMGLHTVGVQEFFVRAPRLYQVQQETGTLLLSPFFGLIRRMMIDEWGVRGTLRIFYLLGRYIRQNSWQMFFFLDVWLRPIIGGGRYPCVEFHDLVFAPCTNFRLFNAITGLLGFIWFMIILAPFFWCIESRSTHKA